MYFEIDEFLETLSGLTREQTYNMIALKQDELIYEVSQPQVNNGHRVLFRSFKFEISFLNKLGLEVSGGSIDDSGSSIDSLRINNILKNLHNWNKYMVCNYELFYQGLRGLTNQQVIDEIYKQMKQYCDLMEEEMTGPVEIYKEKLRIVFEKAARLHPDKLFSF